MSLYQCEQCGCVENTACGWYHGRHFEWSTEKRAVCSACAPKTYPDGTSTGLGEWHGRFPQRFYPLGTLEADEFGNIREKKL